MQKPPWCVSPAALSKNPFVLGVIHNIEIIENCERKYKCFDNSYSLAYKKEVKELTDTEPLVKYSLLFKLMGGANRLKTLRTTHNLEPPEDSASCCSGIREICSSFVRDPVVASVCTAAVLGFSAYAAYNLYIITQTYHDDYSAALNYTRTEEFVKNLTRTWGWRHEIPKCYEACEGFYKNVVLNSGFYQKIPSHVCINPNSTDHDFTVVVHNITNFIHQKCGQMANDLWSEWLNHNLSHFIDTISKSWMNEQEVFKVSLTEKLANSNAFVHEPFFWNDPEGCTLDINFYSYDPVCVADDMTYPTRAYQIWGGAGGTVLFFYFAMMIIGWLL